MEVFNLINFILYYFFINKLFNKDNINININFIFIFINIGNSFTSAVGSLIIENTPRNTRLNHFNKSQDIIITSHLKEKEKDKEKEIEIEKFSINLNSNLNTNKDLNDNIKYIKVINNLERERENEIENKNENENKNNINNNNNNNIDASSNFINTSTIIIDLLNNLDLTKENINSSYLSIIKNPNNLSNNFDIENINKLTEGKLHKKNIWENENFFKLLKILEFWLEIENNIEDKNTAISYLKKLFSFIKSEISDKEDDSIYDIEFFQILNLNKISIKFIKILLIICSSFYIIYHNFILDISLKNQMKKTASAFSSNFLNFFEILFFSDKISLEKNIEKAKLSSNFLEKFNKNLKNHKIIKGTKAPEAIINIIKSIDGSLLIIKQFSKYLINLLFFNFFFML
jgi:hypothetical protein